MIKINTNAKFLLISLATSFLLVVESVNAAPANSFRDAKHKLYNEVYNNTGNTVYCGCKWSGSNIDLASCGLQNAFIKGDQSRLRREAEHIIPASWFYKKNGKYRQCAKDAWNLHINARKYCQEHDADFRAAHNDLVNLFPSVGRINLERSNKPFAEHVNTGKITYSKCTAMTGDKVFVPPLDMRGDIARVAIYMYHKYGVRYSNKQSILFNKWNAQDPISNEEKSRNRKIISSQGYGIPQ